MPKVGTIEKWTRQSGGGHISGVRRSIGKRESLVFC
jgi:hypothetical protein